MSKYDEKIKKLKEAGAEQESKDVEEERDLKKGKFMVKILSKTLSFHFYLENAVHEYYINLHPFDYMFIFSLFLYSGQDDERLLMNYFWNRCSHPIACLMNANLIFRKLSEFTFMQNLSHSKLNELMG